MDREVVLPDRTVLVEDGVIVAVGSADEVQIPRGAERIDGRGKFLLPGLADMHVHLVAPQHHSALALLFVANGVTTVRNMWGNPEVLALRRAVEGGDVLGPRIFTSGPLTDGEPPVYRTARVVRTPAEAEAAVRSDVEAGYDAVKVYSNLAPREYRALTDAARRHGIPVWGHVPDAVGLETAFAAGQRSVEHLQGYLLALQSDRSPLARVPRGRVDETRGLEHVDTGRLPAVVRATREADVWNTPSLVVHQAVVDPEQAARLEQQPAMRYVSPALRAMWKPIRDDWLRSFAADDYRRYRQLDTLMLRLTGALHEAGARLLLGTDAPNPYVVPGFSVHAELRNLVAAGLTPYQALAAATSAPAEFLEADFGVVAAGRRADLLLLNKNPLADVGNAADRAGVMVRGVWYPEAELQRRLAALAAGFEREALPIAAYTGDAARVEALLARGAAVDARDSTGLTPLMAASYAGHAPTVAALVRGGAAVDAVNRDGQTSLVMAAYEGHADVVAVLLRAGAQVDRGDNTGLTPLMAAAYAGHVPVVRALLVAGAEVPARNRRGQTALDLARYQRHAEVVRLLTAAGSRR
jgi:imidazolonepropionase-like amidohydrolase